ncbi:flagellar assembly peptidoglycan hydrolase FlgJ [Gallaecimonas xiamenensis]|uniref:Peptidoglycan hydrolase FlgJ n=1 Tax=Gallaecimonas xiamenensis 3-C-1 TaxID=745411 RepID=K2JLZ8_9GAMM|nr:flagellar assembly peptidoglycan hydrolase FlgJ [Gallaecimonas xiamenensis]EKE75447.1 flagellar rod assembly protein/muramidase FlgJ [Gallaecimonas xiamenensis 3-C-1]
MNTPLFTDLAGLDKLRQGAQKQDDKALLETAKQFESIFVRQLLKSMRDANAVFEKNSPFNTSSMNFYRDMQDQQMALEIANKGGLGLAEIIAQQLKPDGKTLMPASAIGVSRQVSSVEMGTAVTAAKTGGKSAPPAPTIAKASAEEPAPLADGEGQGGISFDSPSAFVGSLLPYARQAASAIGVNPMVLVAQAALETGWGQKVLKGEGGKSSLNLFNIKAGSQWDGDKVTATTLEYEGLTPKREVAQFRAYDSPEASFSDYIQLLKESPRYQEAVKWAKDSARFLQELQGAGYATDPDYAKKILQVLDHPAMSKGRP